MKPPDTRAIVTTIAQQLGETQPWPINQIRRIVQRLGPEAAFAFLHEAHQIEAQGGLMLPDGSRRRTLGGVFFFLVRERVTPEDRAAIFPPWSKRPAARAGNPSSPAAAPPTAPVPQPDTLPNLTGELRTVKITLIGRPGPITTSPAGTITTTLQSSSVPALPKGLPAPPLTPTPYTVYIAPKQWAKVAAALSNPEDVLIVEGFPAADPARPGITVYATNVTTKQLQHAQRAGRQ